MNAFRLAVVIAALGGPVVAQDLKGPEIAATVSGKTILGDMLDGGGYAEFYEADGTIRGDGYTGVWTVEGNTMCFAYDGESAGCFGIRLNGETLAWIVDGEVTGTGTIVEGNVNGW
jgi:hypothetical protein